MVVVVGDLRRRELEEGEGREAVGDNLSIVLLDSNDDVLACKRLIMMVALYEICVVLLLLLAGPRDSACSSNYPREVRFRGDKRWIGWKVST